MDVLPRIARQLADLLRTMSPVQRATFFVVPMLAVAGLFWAVVYNKPDDHQAVLFGKTFSAEELAVAEKGLNEAGLLNYRRSERKLLVPTAELDRYNAALVQFDAVPPDLGSQILKQFESLGPFSTDRHRQEMKDALLLQELRRMIKAVPDIEDARVTVANSARRVGFGQKPKVTANVTVKPRPGRELTGRLVTSLRQAVASMVPDLQAVDVTVFDVARGQSYTGDEADDAVDGRLIQRIREFTRQYEQQIQKAVAFIPNVAVVVHVDLDNLKSSFTRRETMRVDEAATRRHGDIQLVEHSEAANGVEAGSSWEDQPDVPRGKSHSAGFRGPDSAPLNYSHEFSERELMAAMPRSVQVSVSIPREYYRELAARRKAQGDSGRRADLDSIEEEVLTKVERTVTRLIPAGSPHDAISVTTIDRMSVESAEPILTATDQLTILAWKHGGSCALALFVVWALWMLSRLNVPAKSSAPSIPPHAAQPDIYESAMSPAVMATATAAEEIPRTASVPESATIISRPEPETVPVNIPPQIPIVALAPTRSQVVESQTDSAAVSAAKPEPEPFDAGPFQFLMGRHPDDIRMLLWEEQSQTIAVIAAQLPPSISAEVLSGFAPDLQADVLQRVARLGPTDPQVLTDIADVLKERSGRPRVRAGGVPQAAAMLRQSPKAASRSMLASMDDHDADLADELRQTLFSFDDLLKLSDDTLRIVLQETDDRQWALALKASPEAVRVKVLGCLPVRVAQAFKAEMDALGPVRLSEMTSVRQQIADSIRRLEDAGLIELPMN